MHRLISHLILLCACAAAFPGLAATEGTTSRLQVESDAVPNVRENPPTRKAGAVAKTDVSITGSITNNLGEPLCALVLANGQFVFSCSPNGAYSLSLPLDASGQFTLFGFADGHFPYKGVFNGTSGRYDIVLNVAVAGSTLPLKSLIESSNATVTITGSVTNNLGAPVCALVLANGQFTFSCSPVGSYTLSDVPLDATGKITLFVFADGHFPYKSIFNGVGGRYDATLNVARPASSLAIRTHPLIDAIAGVSYFQLAATADGGSPPYHYYTDTFANGAPPLGTGIDLNGNLTGTPSATYTTSRTFTFGVCVADIVATIKCAQTSVTVRPPAPVPNGSVTWILGDQCNNGYEIDYRFFDRVNHLQWPADLTLEYFMNYGNTFRSVLACVPGAQVCFGASSNSGAMTWGLNLSGTAATCSTCCALCDGRSYSTNLTCNSPPPPPPPPAGAGLCTGNAPTALMCRVCNTDNDCGGGVCFTFRPVPFC